LCWPGGAASLKNDSDGTVLEAAIAAGIPIAHSCKRGNCRQCQARVVETSDPAYRTGEIVTLCRVPGSIAAKFELDDNPFEFRPAARLFPAKVAHVTEVAENIVRLSLVIPPQQKLEFYGGQYAALILKDGLQRAYSISDFDPDTRRIDFFIKRVEGGAFAGWLKTAAAPGVMLQVRAPMGFFRLRPLRADTTWFIGTGTGVVPLLAMLQRADSGFLEMLGRIRLLWGNRLPNDAFLRAEIEQLVARLGIDFQMVFSRDVGQGARRVTDVLAQETFSDDVLYAAGHPDMIRDVHDICAARGFKSKRIFSDAFAFSSRELATESV